MDDVSVGRWMVRGYGCGKKKIINRSKVGFCRQECPAIT